MLNMEPVSLRRFHPDTQACRRRRDFQDPMTSFKRLSVLIVEDEVMIRVLLSDMLEELGHTIVGQAAHVDEALALVRSPLAFDLAILDVNLDGRSSEPIAAAIECRGLPFVFATGYGESGIPERFRGRPFLEKPFAIADLSDLLQSVAADAVRRRRR